MWYDRIIVPGPMPWYWIVAISIFILAVVCGFLICACNHKVEWTKTFGDFMKAAHHDKEGRNKIRDIASKKNFGPPKVLIHRFSRANLNRPATLPPDPRLRAGLGSKSGSQVAMLQGSQNTIIIINPDPEQLALAAEMDASKQTVIFADAFNGNSDLPNVPLEALGLSARDEEAIEMAAIQNKRHLLSTEDTYDAAVDSASLITAYSQEFTVPSSEPLQRRRDKLFANAAADSSNDRNENTVVHVEPLDLGTAASGGYVNKGNVAYENKDGADSGAYDNKDDANLSNYKITGKDFGGYDNMGAEFETEDTSFVIPSEPVAGTSREDFDTLTLSSRSASVATTPGREHTHRGSIDANLHAQPLLQTRRVSPDVDREYHAENEAQSGPLPPIDSTSSWASSVPGPRRQSEGYVTGGEVAAPKNDVTSSWASSVIKDRPISARTKWSDESDSDSAEAEMALENCDFSSDTTESIQTEA